MHLPVHVFAPLLGLPSWQVVKGRGSFVTMEFGEPDLRIGEPKMRPLSLEGHRHTSFGAQLTFAVGGTCGSTAASGP